MNAKVKIANRLNASIYDKKCILFEIDRESLKAELNSTNLLDEIMAEHKDQNVQDETEC